jgi:hypothetical protein
MNIPFNIPLRDKLIVYHVVINEIPDSAIQNIYLNSKICSNKRVRS